MTTYLLSQHGRQCRVHASWWTPDGPETAPVALLPDRRTAARLATCLDVLSEAVWEQAVAGGAPLRCPPALVDLVPGGGGVAAPAGGAVPAGGVAPSDPSDPSDPSGPGGSDERLGSGPPDGRAVPTSLRAHVADRQARALVELVADLAPETGQAVGREVGQEVGRELAAAAVTTVTPLAENDRRWQYFRRIAPAELLVCWADEDPQVPFLGWAVGRPLRVVAEPDEEVLTWVADLGEGLEVRMAPGVRGDDPALHMVLWVDGETRARLDLERADEHGHAGSLLAEIRERLTAGYLMDALVRTEAIDHPVPRPEDLADFDRLVERLAALLPGQEG